MAVQSQKVTYCMIAFMCYSGRGKNIATENRSVVGRDWVWNI